MAINRKLITRVAGFCGLTAPIAMFLAVLVAGWAKPGYNHVTEYVSALGTGNGLAAIIMNVFGFGLTGFLIAITTEISLFTRLHGNTVVT